MNTFQVIGIGICALFSAGIVASTLRHRMGPRVGTAWALLWIAAGLAIARPEITVAAARALGIARGADLVFYFGILAMFVGFFAVYVKFRRLDSHLTLLVRQLALRDAREADGGEGDSAGGRASPDPGASG